jgi:hypothetical protein
MTMDASIYVASPGLVIPPLAPPPSAELPDLLRQMLEVQKEQLAALRNQAAAQDATGRNRAFLSRWQGEFPDIGAACKQVLPAIERAYLGLIRDLTDRVREQGDSGLDDEFVLGEFLDRFGMRLGQLGTILSQLGPLADASSGVQ